MHKRSILLAAAAAFLTYSFGTTNASAGSVPVTEDGGTFTYSMTSNGAGVVTTSYSDVLLTEINDAAIPTGSIDATFASTAFTVNSTTTVGEFVTYALSETSPGSKTFGTGANILQSATLDNVVVSASVVGAFLNVDGVISSVVSPYLETTGSSPTVYDFSTFRAGNDVTLSYQQVGANFATTIANGGTIVGTGAFSEITSASVPEPSSMALLGVGMSICYAVRRMYKRKTRA